MIHSAFQTALRTLPNILQDGVSKRWDDFVEAAGADNLPDHPNFIPSLVRAWALSPYAARLSIKHPDWVIALFASGEIDRHLDPTELKDALSKLVDEAETIDALEKTLRIFRNRCMLRIIWRDMADMSDLNNTIRELSALGDACINLAARRLHAWQNTIYGTPAEWNGRPQTLTVLALGKLGGRELNLSSDVDLIFCFPSRGMTDHPEHPISHEEFFNRLGRDLIRVINRMTADGYVFRVDMRLRPHGESGPLVLSFDAMEHYYSTHGRDWERYALIKARVISGDPIASRNLMVMLRQFVYRQEIDYAALQSLRSLHTTISEEVRKRDLEQNIKLGSGTIRSIEFIGQLFQMIHGGNILALRDRRIMRILEVLVEENFLSETQTNGLTAAYRFFRSVEHRLQAVSDLQTHQLPDQDQDEATMRLAFGMDFDTWASFSEILATHRASTQALFNLLLDAPSEHVRDTSSGDKSAPIEEQAAEAWLGLQDAQHVAQLFTRLGFSQTDQATQMLTAISKGRPFQTLSELGKERLARLMPWLLLYTGQVENSTVTLLRMRNLLDAIMERTTYLVLLFENPEAFKLMIKLCSISPWISEQMARYPLLLGELLDQKRLRTQHSIEKLDQLLSGRLAHTSPEHPEQIVESLNYFKLVQVFRTAARDVTGDLPIMKVSDSLTDIAIIMLRHVQNIARWQTIDEHGAPENDPEGDQFAIIAYGKLGGIELGYSSDLDLVFVYQQSEPTESSTQTLSQSEFYTLMARRTLQLLEARTPAGSLYEVDMRLRPSGDAGLLVTNMSTLEAYQQAHAWTWEHQAIMRARIVSGATPLIDRFNQLRNLVLSRPRDLSALRSEVCKMREKMRSSTDFKDGFFDLKQGHGGITDIEFIVQFGVLAWGHMHPEVYQYTDNIRMLESFTAKKLLPEKQARLLCDAYRAYRACVHEFSLQNAPAMIEKGVFKDYRDGVKALWREMIIAD